MNSKILALYATPSPVLYAGARVTGVPKAVGSLTATLTQGATQLAADVLYQGERIDSDSGNPEYLAALQGRLTASAVPPATPYRLYPSRRTLNLRISRGIQRNVSAFVNVTNVTNNKSRENSFVEQISRLAMIGVHIR
jgi:outer membrane receptor protein involved in Fe transport